MITRPAAMWSRTSSRAFYSGNFRMFDNFAKVLETGMKLKTVMKKKNLKAAKAKCPHCDKGFIHGRLAGPKEHLHMYCDRCSISFME